MRALRLPGPPLVDDTAGITLRPWRADDAEALAAAWADPEVKAHMAVPEDASPSRARAWIEGEADRRRRGLALDLVVEAGAEVLGEVGLAHFDAERRAEIGFWLAPAARGRGVATAAVRLLTRWALAPERPEARRAPPGPVRRGLGLHQVWARTVPGDLRAAKVLGRSGYLRRGEAAGSAVWTTDAASLRP